MTNELLVRAILSFDIILEDVLADLSGGVEPNPVAILIMEMLCSQVPSMPDLPTKLQEYIVNMADMSARIKLLTMSLPIEEEKLDMVLGKQKKRLAELGKGVKIVKESVHRGSQSIN